MITVLTGENSYAITRDVRDRISAFEGAAERFEGAEIAPQQLPDIFTGVTLFSSKRLIVLRDIASNKSLWSDLEPWIERVPDDIDLVLIEPNPDKRTKTYKKLQKHGTIKSHAPMPTAELVKWTQDEAKRLGTTLTSDDARYFVGYVGSDQWRLESELEKLVLTGKTISRELITDITEPYPEASAFELLDNVFSGNTARVDELLTLLREREDPYKFFGLLSSQVMALLAISAAGERRADEIARDMSLHPFVVQKLTTVARKLGQKSIVRLIDQLARADERIKTTGVDPWRQLEATLGSIR